MRHCAKCGNDDAEGKDGDACPKCGAKPCPCPRCRAAEGYQPSDPEVIDYDRRHAK